MKNWINYLFVFLFLQQAPWSMGQEELSAQQAVFKALENNYDVLIAQKRQEIASRNNRWSEAGLFPTVSLNAGFNNTVQDNSKNPFTFTPGVILMQGMNPSLSANWNLFSGFAVRVNKQRLEQLEQQSEGNALVVIENTAHDVLKAYYTAVLQKSRLKLYQKLADYSRKRVRYYELREKYSSSNSLEVLQYKNQYLTDSTNVLIQEISYNNSLRNLNLLLNLPEEELNNVARFTLTDSLQVDLPLIEFNSSRDQLFASNQNLKNQYLALELQQSAVELQKSFLYPTLSFQTGITPSYSWLRDLKNPDVKFSTQALSYYGNINLRYTLFNNWKNKRAVETARIQKEIAELSTEQMKKGLTTNLSSLIDLYAARTRLLSISEQNMSYAEQLLDMGEQRFELGSINSVELLNIQNSYYSTLTQHYENLFNRLDTYLEIYKLCGQLGLSYSKGE
ncbi:MAG: TolC family protein [Bacteroidetes bacterium]|nr:MAG: TolC family protein [Bacteroidota bacterium]